MAQKFSSSYYIARLNVFVVEPSPELEPPVDTQMSCAFVSPTTLRRLNNEVYSGESDSLEVAPVEPMLIRVSGRTYLTSSANGLMNSTVYIPEAVSEPDDPRGSPVLVADREAALQQIRMLS